MSDSETRVVVITGATKGLGRAMVDRFGELGHTIVGCGRSADAIANLQTELGEPHRFDVLDVTDDKQVAAWAGQIVEQYAAPDLLINNAGLMNRTASLWEITADEFSQVIDVNIKGVANVIRHYVPAMIERGRGVIVNFSSGWGRSASAEVAPYCATKWAIEGMTRALAEELPEGMAAVPLNPGVINTEMLQECFGEMADQYPDPVRWSKAAVPLLLSITEKENGEPLTVRMHSDSPQFEA